MLLLRKFPLVACLLLTALPLACSSKPEPMKNGATLTNTPKNTRQNTVNKFNPKKVMLEQPESPLPPPLPGEGKPGR